MTVRSDRLPFARSNEPFATRTAVVRDVPRTAICTMLGKLEGRTPEEAARYYYERGSFQLIESDFVAGDHDDIRLGIAIGGDQSRRVGSFVAAGCKHEIAGALSAG